MRGNSPVVISIGIVCLFWLGACQGKLPVNEHHVKNLIINARQLSTQNDRNKRQGRHTLAFILSIKPKTKGTDLIKQGITKPEEHAKRIESLSFHATEYISFQIGDISLPPTVAQYENIHDPSGKIDFIVKLVLEETTWKEITTNYNQLDLVLNDPYWQTGIHHFTFNKQQLARSI